jgi:hypothetical protein
VAGVQAISERQVRLAGGQVADHPQFLEFTPDLELIPGKIWFGFSSVNPSRRSVDGWIWVMPERRTIWLRDVDTRHPVIFYQNGGRRELVIASVARTSASGYLLPSPSVGRSR